MSLKIFYIANMRLPTEKAHGIQIMKTCEALAQEGVELELNVTNRTPHGPDPFEYYDVKRNFVIKRLPCLDVVKWGKAGYRIELVSFAVAVLVKFWKVKGVFYTRDEAVAVLLACLKKHVVWEAHMGHKNFSTKFLIKRRVPIVTISNGLKNLYVEMGAASSTILVAPDAVDLSKFGLGLTQKEARNKIALREDNRIVMYSGSSYSWKGVELLKEAGKMLPDTEVVFVSGKSHQDIPAYLRAADVLVLPNTGKKEISKTYTSPMKLFEYMASGRPIVAADLPSLREIIDESTAYFFEPDNSQSLAKALEKALSSPVEAEAKALRAYEKVQTHTWVNRARSILDFIKL